MVNSNFLVVIERLPLNLQKKEISIYGTSCFQRQKISRLQGRIEDFSQGRASSDELVLE